MAFRSAALAILLIAPVVVLFQNCQSKSTIDPKDLASTAPGSTAGPSPSPAPAPAPFMFANKWMALSASNPPPALYGHTAVYTGSKMIIWGGNDSLTTLAPSGGYMLDLAANAWTAVSGGPTARSKHCAVWTGSKMIIWGGTVSAAANSTVQDGGIYDPVAGTWTTIPAFGLSARSSAACVWDGTEMIVWGGWDSNNVALGDGAMYNPTTNAWAPISSTGAPAARRHPVAVWTGTQMLVWEGTDGANTVYYNDGGLYDPIQNKWTALSETSPPSVRQWGSADISNGIMFIFGGFNGAALGDGYSLDIATGLWSAISTVGALTARYAQSQVMTSKGMVIYGGTNGTSVFNDGAIYY